MSLLHTLEAALTVAAVVPALWLRPWRMLRGALLTPALAFMVLLPGLWLLPHHLPPGLGVQLSGASLAVLMLGWPLAVPVLLWVGAVVALLGPVGAGAALSQLVWVGLAPATLTLLLGALLRRWLPPHPFVYVLGRGFLGTAVCIFVAGALYEWLHRLAGGVALEQALVAHWLMAWGDAFLTGMACAIFVAFVPQWLATWSDTRYLAPPPS